MHCRFDHLLITAPSLAAGETYLRETLGVAPRIGGEHARMGTHNLVVRLGGAMYLEVIAINPAAPRPNRPRWFGLDDIGADAPPRLTTWVARVDDIHAAAAASPFPLGDIEPMSRGPFDWRITIPRDGTMPANGVAPTLIQWSGDTHPASTLPDVGCVLERIAGAHPQADRIAGMLESLGFEGDFSVSPGETPGLVATLRTPAGIRQL